MTVSWALTSKVRARHVVDDTEFGVVRTGQTMHRQCIYQHNRQRHL